jgi:hypothetical protein
MATKARDPAIGISTIDRQNTRASAQSGHRFVRRWPNRGGGGRAGGGLGCRASPGLQLTSIQVNRSSKA